jgi:hypothetical protein
MTDRNPFETLRENPFEDDHAVTLQFGGTHIQATCTCGWTAARRSRIGIDEAIEQHLKETR